MHIHLPGCGQVTRTARYIFTCRFDDYRSVSFAEELIIIIIIRGG